jgi:hypothetical protein
MANRTINTVMNLCSFFLLGCGYNNANSVGSTGVDDLSNYDTMHIAGNEGIQLVEYEKEVISEPENMSTTVIMEENQSAEDETSVSDLYDAPARIQQKQPATSVPGLKNIMAELEDFRLFKASAYSSGYGSSNGMSSQKNYDLCAGGYFTYYFNSDLITDNASGSTTNRDTGRWWVEAAGEGFVLFFESSSGEKWSFHVEVNDQHQLFLNGSRWYHVPKGDEYGNGPASCN